MLLFQNPCLKLIQNFSQFRSFYQLNYGNYGINIELVTGIDITTMSYETLMKDWGKDCFISHASRPYDSSLPAVYFALYELNGKRYGMRGFCGITHYCATIPGYGRYSISSNVSEGGKSRFWWRTASSLYNMLSLVHLS